MISISSYYCRMSFKFASPPNGCFHKQGSFLESDTRLLKLEMPSKRIPRTIPRTRQPQRLEVGATQLQAGNVGVRLKA